MTSSLMTGLEKCLESYVPEHTVRNATVNKFKKLITDTLSEHPVYTGYKLSEDNILKLALNLERGVFNYALRGYCKKKVNDTWNDQFKRLYMNRLVCIFGNLNPNSYIKNVLLLKRLLDGEIDEFELCNLDPGNMFPERHQAAIAKYKADSEAIKPINLDDIPDGILKCNKCKSYKTEYVELQTRSPDEPTSKFCYCHKCGFRWKFC
ncbi:hypothetical protein EB118_02045 [bacterium]|nr:hypothetical protein [bacterium]NDC94199.1 hypothetical protein [bacterium]NDD83031.1 hypothetical protein [bacterium]NDG28869.1 hypothetical protein [bacterium]